MPLWRILVYAPDGVPVPPFTTWYDSQDIEVRSKILAALLVLSGIEDWNDSDVEEFKALTGRDEGLGEVRTEVIRQEGKKQIRRQIRCLGIWPADGKEFVLLNGLVKSGRSPNPPNAYI